MRQLHSYRKPQSNAATGFPNVPGNCVSINNIEIMQVTTRAINLIHQALNCIGDKKILPFPCIQHCKVACNVHLSSGAPNLGCSLMGQLMAYPRPGARTLQLLFWRIRLGEVLPLQCCTFIFKFFMHNKSKRCKNSPKPVLVPGSSTFQ